MLFRSPQPETVRMYMVAALSDDGVLDKLARVTDNYQRHRVHRFPPITTRTIRVYVAATNGLDHARIFEIRAYA